MSKKLALIGLSIMLTLSPAAVFAAEDEEGASKDVDAENISNEDTNATESEEDDESDSEDSTKDEDATEEKDELEDKVEDGEEVDASQEDSEEGNEEDSEEVEEQQEEESDESEETEESDEEENKADKSEEDANENEEDEEESTKEVNEDTEEDEEELDLSSVYGTANGEINYDFNKGHYVLGLKAGIHEITIGDSQGYSQKWVAFALPDGVDIAEELTGGMIPITLPDGKNGIAVKIPDLTEDDSSKYVNHDVPLTGVADDNDPNRNIYLLDVDTSSNQYDILGQLRSERDIDFSVMEENPSLDLDGSIAGKAEFDSDEGYYMLDVTVKSQNQTDSNVDDLYAGIEIPEGVTVLNNDNTPANIKPLNLEDGTRALALKLPEMNTDSERKENYQIPVIGESTDVVESSTINAYRIADDGYMPVGEYEGSINVDFSEMTEQWDFNAESQIVKDFPELDDDQFGLRFAFNSKNLTLDDVDQVKVEFNVPNDVTVHEPDKYTHGDIPDSLEDFLGEDLGGESLDLEWNGNTAVINLDTVDEASSYEGFFTAIGESNKAISSLEGMDVTVTLFQNGDEVVKELDVPFEVVPYEGPTEPEDPEEPEGPKDPEEPEKPEEGENGNDPEEDPKDESEEEDVDQSVTAQFGDQTSVEKGQVVEVEGTDISISLPNDLPEGTEIIVSENNEANIEGLTNAGDLIDVEIILPEGAEEPQEDYTLTLGVDPDSADEDVEIFYLNGDDWEGKGGTVDQENNTITKKVGHFSTYGVFLAEDDENENGKKDVGVVPNDNKKDSDGDEVSVVEGDNDEGDRLPSTATSTFNWLVGGFMVLMAGAAGLFIRKKKSTPSK